MDDWVDFAALKQAVSLEAVLRHYQVPLRTNRYQLEGCCPIHRGKRADSFRVSLTRNVFHCFACQASGDVLDFVAAMEQCSIRQAALRLGQWFGFCSSDQSHLRPVPSTMQKGELVREKERCNPPLSFALTGVNHSHPYLVQRGVDLATAVEFGIGFYPGPGLLSRRIVIPISNVGGQRVAYAGRSLDGTLPKYRLPPRFHKTLELFNLHRAAATPTKTVILVEGYFDCLRVHQAGLPGVVALMGASLSIEQEKALLERFEQVVLLLDGDQTGRAATRTIAARLSSKCLVACVQLPDRAQPDQLSLTVINQLLQDLEMTQETRECSAPGNDRQNPL